MAARGPIEASSINRSRIQTRPHSARGPAPLKIVKIRQTGKAWAATIPKEYMGQLKWHPGDSLVLAIEGPYLVMSNLKIHQVALRKGYRAPGKQPALPLRRPS